VDDLLKNLVSQAVAQGWVQWVSFISGIFYIYFATRNNPWCWPWGILSSGLWAYASWFQLHLFSDAILQIIYVLLGLLGWYQWVAGSRDSINTNKALPVTRYTGKTLMLWVTGSLPIAFALGYIMHFTAAAFPYIDAFLTVFSLLATWMLVNRKIENWLLWIIIDLVSIPVFIWRDGHLFALLFLIYALLAIKGWKSWKPLLITNY